METSLIAMAMLVLTTALALIGLAGIVERLPRSRWLGLRVASMRDDDEAWRVGHRAAGGTLIAAAGPPLLLAVSLFVAPPAETADWFLIYAAVGVVSGGLIALAVRQAERAVQGPDAQD